MTRASRHRETNLDIANSARTESLWSRGLRDTRSALTGWFLVLAIAIGVTAAGVFLGPLPAVVTAVGIAVSTLVVSLLRAPVRQRDELRRALRGAEAGDDEARAMVRFLQAESVCIFGSDFSLADVLLALENELAQGWRLGTLADQTVLWERLGLADRSDGPEDRGLSPLAVAGRLRVAGVVALQHLQRGPGPWPLFPGPPPSDIASLSPLGQNVVVTLRSERIPIKRPVASSA